MRHNTDLEKLERTINYYFKDIGLLKHALTHSSYANEMKINKYGNNERLEFLGDAVLELISSEYLFNEHSNVNEGELTKLRASMVCEPSLAFCAREIKLEEYIMLGKGEDATGGRTRDSIISDALEAVIGAIYLDGGFASAKEFILYYVLNDLDNKKLFFDSKTILQEMLQAHSTVPEYRIIGESGPEHCKTFEAEVFDGDRILGRGKGHNKKSAEQKAAYNAIVSLKSRQGI
ncbi:MAG: ribonuclease III [Clostridia bacterium]|nr:ribonuclease III [Clostridia bacterium]